MEQTLVIKNELKKQRRKVNARKNLSAWCYLFPFIFLFGFSTIPIFWGVFVSFLYEYNPYDTTKSLGDFLFCIDNYAGIFGVGKYALLGKAFWESMGFTALYAVILVPVMIIVPLGLAYVVNIKPVGYKIFRAIIYLPNIISASVMGTIFLYLFNDSSIGFFNAVFGNNIKWISTPTLRFVVILLATVWWQTGSNFLIFSAALRDVDKSLYEASSMDGCSKWEQFVYVTFPAIKQQFNLLLFTTLIGYLGLYSQVKIIRSVENGTSWPYDMETPMMILQEGVVNKDLFRLMGTLSAVAIVYGIIVFTLSQIQLKITGEKKGGKHIYEDRYNLFIHEKA